MKILGATLRSLFTFINILVDDDLRQRNISTKAAERKKRLTLWEEKLQRDQQLLVEETKKHNDILIVDVKDYYRNIPKKLLMFYKW